MGEFEKRIKQILPFKGQKPQQPGEYHGEEADDVLKIVVEAKKEFQANIIHGHYKEDGSLCKHAPYIHPNKAIEWFDKWFGKANTEE